MQVNELRINNYVLFSEDSTIFQVGEIHNLGLTVENEDECTWIEIDQFEPIPLTEEWLVKFGEIKFLSKDVGGYFIWFNGRKIYIKFVHSLQNFYFCIEQKELI